MTALDKLPADLQARIDAAISWRARLKQNPALELTAGYLEWISDPANHRVAHALEEGLEAFDDAGSSPELLDIRRKALGQARRRLPKRWHLSEGRLWQLAAAAFVVAVVGSAALYGYLVAPLDYETGIGERKVVQLVDGSRISLDSDSEVKVRYTNGAREIELEHGRARFDVAHDVTRPFTVSAGSETVVAVGTIFNVERLGQSVLVTLIQGRVVIKEMSEKSVGEVPSALVPRSAVSLAPGQQLVTKVHMRPVIAQANLQTAVAWESGRLVFQDESLGEAVERVNRYTDKPITVDPAVAGIRINGVFNAGDVGSFVGAVTSYFPVQASTDSDNNIVLQKRS
jgi:transmembrane sensor